MSRYIEQEYIGRTINHLPTQYISQECENNKTEVEIMVSIIAVNQVIKEAPTIDIVRCKECKHREKYPCDEIEFYECSHLRLYGTKVGVEDDWFCADGERKESE